VRRKTIFKTDASIPENFIVRISAIQTVRVSHGSDPGERIVLVEYSANSAKRIRREMKAGEYDIERIAKNHISGCRRSEKISRYLVKKIPLDCKTEILEREVFTINTASPSVISNCAAIIVKRCAVRAEQPEAEFITAEVACRRWWWWWRSDFLGTGDCLSGGR
jgi:hypothetical protein